MKQIIPTILALCLLSLGGWLFFLEQSQSNHYLDLSGQEFPDLSQMQFIHKPIEDLQKPTVYIWWALWCPNCLSRIPVLNQLHKQYGNRINFIGISLENNDATLEYARSSIQYSVAFDPTGSAMAQFQAQFIPFYAIRSKEGKVLWQGNEFEPEMIPRFFP
jgi:thiol-disulfide isomerase/thioredoxin